MVLLQALTTGYFSFAATAVANVAAAATTRIPGGVAGYLSPSPPQAGSAAPAGCSPIGGGPIGPCSSRSRFSWRRVAAAQVSHLDFPQKYLTAMDSSGSDVSKASCLISSLLVSSSSLEYLSASHEASSEAVVSSLLVSSSSFQHHTRQVVKL